jgi:hypothetical protein
VQQIEEYAKAHFRVALLSLESVHRPGAMVEAKRVLGCRMQVVYIGMEAVRADRGVQDGCVWNSVGTCAKGIREIVPRTRNGDGPLG